MMLRILFITSIMIMSLNAVGQSNSGVWYSQPADTWMETLPVGNGRMGAMIYGGIETEHFQLNEDSMWPGSPNLSNAKGTAEDLALIRKLIDEGKVHEADSLIIDKFSRQDIVRSHQTAGDLFLHFKNRGEVTNYKRSLDFEKATSYVSYSVDGNTFKETAFSSQPDNVLVIKLETSNQKGMDFDIEMSRPKDEGVETVKVATFPEKQLMLMNGEVTQMGGVVESVPTPIKNGVKFQTRLKVKSKSGIITSNGNRLTVRNAKEVLLLIATETSYYHPDYIEKAELVIENAESKGYKALVNNHIQDFKNLYNRVSLHIETDNSNKEFPTDKRLERYKAGVVDVGLQETLFNYGRYLLISSSRKGTNPANLQGIWNNHITAPWNADYHLNINLQMNYWLAPITNLAECELPLFDFGSRLIIRGKETAKQYGINRGSMSHHATDLWGPAFMRARTPYWGAWIHGAGWLAQHYWEYYLFTEDEVFLKEQGYPYLKEVATFYLDWLQYDESTKEWFSYPETSPENSYIANDGKPAAVSRGTAMGQQIIGEVFRNIISASEILAIDDELIKEVKKKAENLRPGVQIGADGRVLEWDKNYEEPEKGHRHISHMYALYPGNKITPETPDAFKAAQKSIEYRLEHGGAGTGWSRAWMINFNARLLDAVSAEENINKFFEKSIAPNLFDEHPPFQIDGNFGYTAGIAELLLQSHEGFIRILPTLPKQWKSGTISGLKARGNIEVDITWNNGKLVSLHLLSAKNKDVEVVYNNKKQLVTLVANQKTELNGDLE